MNIQLNYSDFMCRHLIGFVLFLGLTFAKLMNLSSVVDLIPIFSWYFTCLFY